MYMWAAGLLLLASEHLSSLRRYYAVQNYGVDGAACRQALNASSNLFQGKKPPFWPAVAPAGTRL